MTERSTCLQSYQCRRALRLFFISRASPTHTAARHALWSNQLRYAHWSNQLRYNMPIGQISCDATCSSVKPAAMRYAHWSNQLRDATYSLVKSTAILKVIGQANRDATCSLVNSRTKHAMCCRVWVGAGTLGKTLGFHENCSETENGASSEGVGKRRTSFLARH